MVINIGCTDVVIDDNNATPAIGQKPVSEKKTCGN